jgi:hypothetical protein
MMVVKGTMNGERYGSNVIKAGTYTMVFSEKHVPQPTTELVSKNNVIEFLNREMESCMNVAVCNEFVLGLEMAILIVTNINAYYDDNVLKFYIVEVLRESTELFKKYGMDMVIVGMTHAWLLIENMKGVKA